MSVKRLKQNILILFISACLLLLLPSCNSNCSKKECGFPHHIEEKEGVIIEFDTPDNYTKDIRSERENTAFFNDKNIILWDATIYFSSEESRSYVSLYVFNRSKEDIHSKNRTLDTLELLPDKSFFLNKMDWDARLPLIYRGIDNKGNPYCYIMQFTRYSHSDTTGYNIPIIESNSLPMDSVETNCYFYTIIDNKEVQLQDYILQSIEDFSFMNIVTLLKSIKVYTKQ